MESLPRMGTDCGRITCMKRHVLLAVLTLVLPAIAGKVRLPALPPDFADTEVSTNVGLAPSTGSRLFVASLSLRGPVFHFR